MKMKPEHYAQLKQAIQAVQVEGVIQPPMSAKSYLDRNMTAAQWRWDLMYLSDFDTHTVYGYCTDDDIDTALRRITGTN